MQSDKDLAEVKENFIEESQELALGNSKYLEYNQRFAIQREEYITKVLGDVNESNKKYAKLKADKNNVMKQVRNPLTAALFVKLFIGLLTGKE